MKHGFAALVTAAILVGTAVATPRAQAFEVLMVPVQAKSFQDLLKNSDFKLELKKEGDRLVAFLGGIKGNFFFWPAFGNNASATVRVAGYSAEDGFYVASVTHHYYPSSDRSEIPEIKIELESFFQNTVSVNIGYTTHWCGSTDDRLLEKEIEKGGGLRFDDAYISDVRIIPLQEGKLEVQSFEDVGYVRVLLCPLQVNGQSVGMR